MKEKSARSMLRELPERPTLIRLGIAAFSFGFLGAIFTAISALAIALLFNEFPRPAFGLAAVGVVPAFVFFGVSLALLPSENRFRQMMIVAIVLITAVWISYQWQHGLAIHWYLVGGVGDPAPVNLFSRATVIAIMATALGSFLLSKLTGNFKI